jgi:hypothetical protein
MEPSPKFSNESAGKPWRGRDSQAEFKARDSFGKAGNEPFMVLTAPRSAERIFGLSPNARNVFEFFSNPFLCVFNGPIRVFHEKLNATSCLYRVIFRETTNRIVTFFDDFTL